MSNSFERLYRVLQDESLSFEQKKEQLVSLLQAGADINAYDDDGVTLLYTELEMYFKDKWQRRSEDEIIEEVEFLLQKGANPNLANQLNNNTFDSHNPLLLAAQYENDRIASLLIQYGASIEESLKWAMEHKWLLCEEFLKTKLIEQHQQELDNINHHKIDDDLNTL